MNIDQVGIVYFLIRFPRKLYFQEKILGINCLCNINKFMCILPDEKWHMLRNTGRMLYNIYNIYICFSGSI